MPVKPLEILELASLLSKAEAEAAHRAAISRAYYAVYHHGVRVVDIKLPLTKGLIYRGGCHQQLFEKINDGRSIAWRDIANKVDHLKRNRVIADYYLNVAVTKTTAENSVTAARRVIDALDSI